MNKHPRKNKPVRSSDSVVLSVTVDRDQKAWLVFQAKKQRFHNLSAYIRRCIEEKREELERRAKVPEGISEVEVESKLPFAHKAPSSSRGTKLQSA